MSVRDKIVRWAFGKELEAVREETVKQVQGRFEAAYWNTLRSYLPGYIQGARQDIDSMSREEILRRVRYFEKNSNVMQKALSILGVNVIGSGIRPTPSTDDEGWNEAACEWWSAFVDTADVTGRLSLYEMQDVVFRAQNVDGDHGVELTLNASNRPGIRLIEAHRITSAGMNQDHPLGKFVDGILIDGNGRPLIYAVADEFDQRVISQVLASRFVHFFTQRRAGQYRGVSLFHSAILDLHDLDDLQKFEMKAAKDAAAISKIVETAAGSATVDGAGIGRSLQAVSTPSPGQKAEYYRSALGGETIYTFPGDKYQQFMNDRPSAATSGFWDKLENKFVQGSGLSYAALCDYRGNWGGATLRAAVTSDNRLFSLRTIEQARKWQRVWDYAIGWAMDRGELKRNPQASRVRWHPPRRTTVDIGHESDARINELKTGLQTYEGIYGEEGNDWRERLEQRAIEEAFINELAEKYDIPPVRIASFEQERVTVTAQGADPEAGDGAGGENSDPAGKPAKAKP